MVKVRDVLEAFKDLRVLSACNHCVYQKNKECINGSFCIWNDIGKMLEVLSIIYNSPFIIDNLVELGKLPPEAKKRYLFGTITNAEVEKVEEFFKNGEK